MQRPPLTDEALAKQQEQYRQAYLEQLRRMSCPGCGDDGMLPSRSLLASQEETLWLASIA